MEAAAVARSTSLVGVSSRRHELPCSRPSWGAPRRLARRQQVQPAARQRAPWRATPYQQQPPVNPSRSRRYTPGQRQQPNKNKEPFDAELLVLFGLPCLVLGIAYAFNDPDSLLIALPLALLIPGPRDVLLHVGSDLWRGARRAKRFVSVESEDHSSQQQQWEKTQQQQQREQVWRQQQRAQHQAQWSGQAVPPPPPPPPPRMADYEARGGPYSGYQHPTAPPPPPPQAVYFEGGWQPQVPHSPFENGWPPASPGGTGPIDDMASWQQEQAPPAAAPQPPPGQGWAPPPDSNSRNWPSSRGGGPSAAMPPSLPRSSPAARQRQPGRLARPASKGRVGIDLSRGASGSGRQRAQREDRTPVLLRPLFALIPFLRYWGGFL